MDALNGWKQYFEKMSAQKNMEVENELREDDLVEDEGEDVWTSKGKLSVLEVSVDEYTSWCKPYANYLIVKLMGKSFGVGFMRQHIERMWGRPMNLVKVMPLNNGYFIVYFSSEADRNFALQEGPWMIGDYYLLVQRWRPNFNPWKADNQKKIAAWIRILDLLIELYNVESLRRMEI